MTAEQNAGMYHSHVAGHETSFNTMVMVRAMVIVMIVRGGDGGDEY